MVMYKQNQGLMAKGTVGTQSTGGTMMPQKKPTYSLASTGGAQAPGGRRLGAPSAGDFLGEAGYFLGNLFTSGQYGIDREREARAKMDQDRARQEAAQKAKQDEIDSMAQALGKSVMAARTAAASGGMAAPGRMSAPGTVAPAQSSAATQEQGLVTPDFRLQVRGPFSGLVSPYGTDYRTGLMSRVSGQTARQFAPQREQLEANLAARGISRESPLFQSMMAQQEATESGARLQAVSAAEESGIQAAANWEMQRAQGEAVWQKNLQNVATDLARQPGELAQLEAAGRLTAAQADIANIDALIKADPDVRAATKKKVLAESGMSDAEYQAAMRLLETTDPNKWWNHHGWGIAGSVVDNALKISQAFKNFTTAGK